MKRFTPRARGRAEPDRQTVQPRAHRRPRAAGSSNTWVRNPIRSGCGCRSTAPGTAAGTPKAPIMRRLLLEDLKIRNFIMKTLPQAAISKVVIERPAKLCRVSIYAARPGVIIGKKGADIEKLRKQLGAMTSSDVSLNIVEIRKPEIDARLVAQGDRRPARAPDRLPPRDEARRPVVAAPRRRGHQDHLRRPSRRRRDRPHRMVSRRPGAAAHASRQSSIMPRRPPTPPTACAASRCGSSRARSSATIRWLRIG